MIFIILNRFLYIGIKYQVGVAALSARWEINNSSSTTRDVNRPSQSLVYDNWLVATM